MGLALARAALLFSLLALAWAQEPTGPQFDIWTNENGLPQNTVTSILQTRDGYLWLTTFDGLVRFDGVNFAIFNTFNAPGMRTNRLTRLFEDQGGTLWAITELAGLTEIRNGKFQTYTTADGLPSNKVRRLRDLDDGSVLIETASGFTRFGDGRFTSYDATAKFADFGYPVSAEAVWHQDASGLHRVVHGKSKKDVSLTGLPPGVFEELFEDSRGDLWGWIVPDRLCRWHAGAWKSYPVGTEMRILAEDQSGTVWTGTVQGSLARLEGERVALYPVPSNTIHEMVHALYRDREKGFWIGCAALLRLRTSFIAAYSKGAGLESVNTFSVLEDRQNRMWIGSWPGLSEMINGRAVKLSLPDPARRGIITALFEDRAGGIWAAEFDVGLYHLTQGSTQFRAEDPRLRRVRVYAVVQDRAGDLWLGTARGLFHYTGANPHLYTQADGLADNEIRTLHFDRDGTLWAGTLAGLNYFRDGKIGTIAEVPKAQVRTIYEDSEGVLWIGTYDHGMIRLAHGKSTAYTTRQGLSSNGVFQILEDDAGRFWMSSNTGISRVSRRDLEDVAAGKIQAVTSVAYGTREGMLNVECNGGTQPGGIRARDGRLWFPTQDGVVVVDPARVPENRLPPPVLIESCLLDHQPVHAEHGLHVPPGKSDLEIHYTALSFAQPEHVRFKYQMEGLDADWVEAGSRRVVYYSHVPPGQYRFRVIAANSDGVWNRTGAAMTVIVVPPYWRTWWFTLIVVVIVIAAALWLYRRRIQSLQAARLAQESFSRQLVASQEQERKRIAAELHDGLGQNLLVIKNWALLGSDSRTEKRLQEIAAIASQSLEEVREIAHNLRPHQLDELGLTQALRSIVTRIADSSPVHFVLECDPVDRLFDNEQEINLYRIVQESVNNILKHSGATEARISIRRNAGTLQIAITDNGQGFDFNAAPAHPRGGSGIPGMIERARMIGAHVSISAAPGSGATISVSVPVKE
jgi:signal transduction histidine kinase/ligand-binding sensor domain-containing protein